MLPVHLSFEPFQTEHVHQSTATESELDPRARRKRQAWCKTQQHQVSLEASVCEGACLWIGFDSVLIVVES